MNLIPIKNKVFILEDSQKETTDSGIRLVQKEGADRKAGEIGTGTVQWVGPAATTLQSGDKAVYITGSGRPSKLNGEEYLRFTEDEVYGTITKTEDSKMEFHPLSDRILVREEDPAAKTNSGILIPDTAQTKTNRGEIVAAGPGRKDDPITVKAGNKVCYGEYSGVEMEINGETFMLMRESDIYGIIQD